MEGFDSAVLSAWVSDDEKNVGTLTMHGGLDTWEVATGKRLAHWELPNDDPSAYRAYKMARLSSDQRILALWNQNQPQHFEIWDLALQTEIARIRAHTREVTDMAFSPDGKWLATASDDFTVKAWPVGLFVQPLSP